MPAPIKEEELEKLRDEIIQQTTERGFHNITDITNTCVDNFKRAVLEEVEQWRVRFLEQQGVTATKRQRPVDLYDEDRTKKHKHNASFDDDAEDDEDEEQPSKNIGAWKCLFFEHDPNRYPQCGQRRYKRVSELRRHIKTHTLPHYCSACGYRTAEERRLGGHKCEESNRKRYEPVTEEDKQKHEQLAKMGVKVGQMKMILFGTVDGVDQMGGAGSHGMLFPQLEIFGV